MSSVSISTNKPELIENFIRDKKLDKAAQQAFEAIFDFIVLTQNLSVDDQQAIATPIVNYARSIFDARQAGKTIPPRDVIANHQSLTEDLTLEQKQELGEKGQAFADAINVNETEVQKEIADGADSPNEVTDASEEARSNQLLEMIFGGLQKHIADFEIVKNVSDKLAESPEFSGDESSLEAQGLITTVFQQAMVAAEKARKSGELTTDKEVEKLIHRRVAATLKAINASENNEVKITSADLKLFSKNMGTLIEKTGKDLNKQENRDDLLSFLGENKLWIVGIVAIFSQPLAQLFSKLPFGLGYIPNTILSQVHSNLVPMGTAAMTGLFMRGGNSTHDSEQAKQAAQYN